MGGGSSHHIANVYHCPVTVSVSPEATFADKVNDRKVQKIAAQANVTAGLGPAETELGASGSYTKEVGRSGVHSRHDDNFVVIHPGRIKRLGTGGGDFVTITVEEQGTTRYLAKNHKLWSGCGLIVRPDGSLADAMDKSMISAGHTDYTTDAAILREERAQELREEKNRKQLLAQIPEERQKLLLKNMKKIDIVTNNISIKDPEPEPRHVLPFGRYV